ncbi:hypothetical protein KY332_01680 [Candidatus Woesearchaeota archaeon]|nr:hypothetical protein [Candidatus Woesearchaeota archaeon]
MIKIIRNAIIGFLIAYMLGGCGDSGSSKKKKNPAPSITLESIVQDDFENSGTDITLTVTDNGGVDSVNVIYTSISYNDVVTLTDIGNDQYQTTLNLDSETYNISIVAYDNKGKESTLDLGQVVRYGNEVNTDSALDNKLSDNTDGVDVTMHFMNDQFDLDGVIIKYDAEAVVNGKTYILWVQGENDGEHLVEKAKLEEYNIYWIQINPLPLQDIDGVIDQIDLDGWIPYTTY